MSIEEQVKLRRTRVASATRRGKTVRKVEMVSVMTCENLNTKSCGEFIYLGSKIDTSASATPEIKRRINMAMVSFAKLNRIWKAKSLSRRTKAALYQAIILSVMLYNAEVWPIRQQDMKALEGAHFRMMRRMMIDKNYDEHISREELLSTFKLPTMSKLITRKRLRWIGHALRRKDGDRSKIAVCSAMEDAGATWTKLVLEDCRQLGTSFKEMKAIAKKRLQFKRTIIKGRSTTNEKSSSSNKHSRSSSNSSSSSSDSSSKKESSRRSHRRTISPTNRGKVVR